jgi:Family of unknown function (DUF6800)
VATATLAPCRLQTKEKEAVDLFDGGNAMSGSLRPTEIRKRRHRKEKRRKLRAKLANAPAHERSTLEAKLQKIGGFPKK